MFGHGVQPMSADSAQRVKHDDGLAVASDSWGQFRSQALK